MQLLIVDDDVDIRRVLARMLAGKARVSEVGSLAEARLAIVRFAARRDDLGLPDDFILLTDYQLENGTGGDLVAWTRARWPGVFVVVMTANELLAREDVRLDGIPVLAKPFAIEDLEEVIRGRP